jgi:hypothetical protein
MIASDCLWTTQDMPEGNGELPSEQNMPYSR